MISARRTTALERTDALPATLRVCVHEFGGPIVNACIMAGVRNPQMIRFLVKEIWAGARQTGQTSGAYGTLDWLLIQNGVNISAVGLRRLLADYSLAILPLDPTREMINASLAEISGFNERVTKHEKHKRRLRVALRAGLDAALRPHLRDTPEPQDRVSPDKNESVTTESAS